MPPLSEASMTINDRKPTKKRTDSGSADHTKPTRQKTDSHRFAHYTNSVQPDKLTHSNLLMGLKQLAVALLYLLLGTVIHHYFTNEGIGILWSANGLALAVVLIGGRRYLWAVLLGSVLLHVPFKEPLFAIFGISLANITQVFIGSWLLTHDDRSVLALHTLRDYLRLITLGGFVASMLAAIFASGVLLLTGLIPSADYFISVSRWWTANSLGIVLVTPLILAWWQTKSEKLATKQYLEAILLIGITFILGQIIFLGWINEHLLLPPKAFIMFLPITLIAIRLGTRATTLTLNIVAIQALLGAYLKTGYFANEIAAFNLNNYWLYVLILSGISMALTTYVNELKQKELSLRKSESQLRLSQNSGGVGTWEADLITNKLVWSDSCRALIGLIREPKWDDFINALYPEDRQRVINAIQSHIKHGTKYEVEYRVITTTGSIRWIRSSGQVERNAQGKPIIMRGIAQDITEHHKNQQRIERLLEEQRAILDNRLVGIATVRNQKIVWANPACETMLGYKKGETVGVSARHFYAHEQDYQAVQQSYKNTESIVSTQYELIRKDGRHIWVDVSRSLLHKETGEALLVFIDVTKNKHSELKLINHNKHLKDADSRWLITNELAKQLFQLHYIPWQGKTEMELAKLHPEFNDAHQKCLIDDNETWKAGRLTLFTEQVVDDNGQIFDFEVRKIPIFDDQGRRQGLVILGRDVTERKQVEAELRIAAIAFESQEGMFITDANNVILRVNSAFTNITGYAPEEVVGKDPKLLKMKLNGWHSSTRSPVYPIGDC